jgi:hypothetical protein
MLMGFGIYLTSTECNHCGVTPEAKKLRRPSYALSALFQKALPAGPLRPTAGLRGLHGLRASLAVFPLVEGLKALEDPAQADAFDALLPASGMGSRRGAVVTLQELLEACRAFPDWTVEVE